jgi:hypothetical protein
MVLIYYLKSNDSLNLSRKAIEGKEVVFGNYFRLAETFLPALFGAGMASNHLLRAERSAQIETQLKYLILGYYCIPRRKAL